jgi:hypothetical protein
MRHLVQEALLEEGVVRVPDRAPVTDRQHAVDNHVRDALVGNLVVHVVLALGRGLVRADAGQAQVAREVLVADGTAGRLVVPAEHVAGAVQRGSKPRQRRRPVYVVGNVVLAGPDKLHRLAVHRGGHRHRLRNHVGLEPAPEAAAQQRHLDHHVLARHAGHPGRNVHRDAWDLCRHPQPYLAPRDLRGAVDRFHRRMRQERRAVFGRDGFGGARHCYVAARVIGIAGFLVERVRQPGKDRLAR